MTLDEYHLTGQKALWNHLAATEEFLHPFDWEMFLQSVDSSQKVLDVGCGYGRILDILYNNGFRKLYGIDIAEEMVNRAKREFPFLNVAQTDGKEIPFPSSSIDAVIAVSVLTCLITDSDSDYFMGEINRILKPGGILYLGDYILSDRPERDAQYELGEKKYGCQGVFEKGEGIVFRHYARDRVLSLLKGYEVIHFSTADFTSRSGSPSTIVKVMARKSN